MLQQFGVISAKEIYDQIFSDVQEVVRVVRGAYVAHARGATVNPSSHFLRLPNHPNDRIIALPAHVATSGAPSSTGIKWIASYPGNIDSGIPRASAVIILNDERTGFPRVCLEGSIISAARTAASAAIAASELAPGGKAACHALGVVGCGLIARYIVDFLVATGWRFDQVHVHDRVPAHAVRFVERIRSACGASLHQHDEPEAVAARSDIVVFATTASTPYFVNHEVLSHNPLVLHISLRDLAPELILRTHNVVDDVEHCMRERTSVHLAEQIVGSRTFIQCVLPAVLVGEAPAPDSSKPTVFSPFGLGVLDVALAQAVFEKIYQNGGLLEVPEFFGSMERI